MLSETIDKFGTNITFFSEACRIVGVTLHFMSGYFPSKRYAGPSPPLKSDNFFQFSYLTMSRIEKNDFQLIQKKLLASKVEIFTVVSFFFHTIFLKRNIKISVHGGQ